MKHTNILVAGATGYLGRHLVQVLIEKQNHVVAIARNPNQLKNTNENYLEIKQAQVTQPETLRDMCKGIDTVISTVGITRQKDGLTYMDVDYQANMNILNEAKKSGVNHFVYVSAIHGDRHRDLKIFEAKERFVDALKASGLSYTIVRPNGFFSDMKDFLQMAQSGRVFVFGSGNQLFNPIHGEDVARAMVEHLGTYNTEITLGGPDVLSLNEISKLALQSLNKPVKITHLPDCLRRLTIWVLRTFTSVKTYGPVEFFLTLMANDTVAPPYGKHRLKEYFRQEAHKLIQ
ncbi:SDR family oxidoreductase [Marixanthomonas sp. SCSIO 43207]|uniref:SDR family oxidoreductase n=1 Tax=Marixanthomonas sp. SCSIO 43207 TaxID=2779360 RepID=UPI001CA8A6E8|nr:SDR family oxidoreductase [Marixanthomonas sp. SCSIO 43207]UAB80045.1 SDR family oxidoreductase [Marixanthomonas sp. SCSIO 43207]